jgi:hypothetical protein
VGVNSLKSLNLTNVYPNNSNNNNNNKNNKVKSKPLELFELAVKKLKTNCHTVSYKTVRFPLLMYCFIFTREYTKCTAGSTFCFVVVVLVVVLVVRQDHIFYQTCSDMFRLVFGF